MITPRCLKPLPLVIALFFGLSFFSGQRTSFAVDYRVPETAGANNANDNTDGPDFIVTETGDLTVPGKTIVTGGDGAAVNSLPAGNGGKAELTVTGSLTSTAVEVIAGDGTGGNFSNYGSGGDANLTVNNHINATDDITISGGGGGFGQQVSPTKPDGGASSLVVGGNLSTTGGLNATGGGGGNSNNSPGGEGGAVSIHIGGDLSTGNVNLTAGNGGYENNFENAGDGGNVSVNVTDRLTVSSTLTLTSGSNGTVNHSGYESDGGKVTLTTGVLSAPTIILTKNGGDFSFTAVTLDVTQTDTTLTMTGTFADGDVGLGTIRIGNGKTFVTPNAGFGFTGIETVGSGTLTLSGGNLDVDGKVLSFVMDSSTASPSTMLTVSGGTLENVDAATIKLSGVPTGLNEGESVTLIAGAESTAAEVDIQNHQMGRRTFDITQDDMSADVIATLKSVQTFTEYQAGDPFNANLMSGAAYLDYLDNLAGFDPALMAKIEEAFNAADALGGRNAALAKQQLFGGYAAYANQALSDDMSRFRQSWQGRNRSFLDAALFAAPADPCRPCPPALKKASGIWAGGFGTWAKQDDRNNLPGYKYDSQGVVLGYERALGRLNLGFAASYSRGDLKVNHLRHKNKPDVLNLALYGAYLHDSGFYAEGGLGYGHAWNDYRVDYIAPPGGVKRGKYGSDVFTADLRLGFIARLPADFNLIPSVGVEYTYLRNGSWTERVTAGLTANRFRSGHDNGVDIPVGLRFNKMFRFGTDGGFIVPEVRAAYVYAADGSRPAVVAGFAGAPGGRTLRGVDPARNRWRVGAGLSGRVNSRVDFRVEYDFEKRSGFKGHSVNANVGVSF